MKREKKAKEIRVQPCPHVRGDFLPPRGKDGSRFGDFIWKKKGEGQNGEC